MRLVTYSVGPAGPARAGVRVGHRILDIEAASRVNGEPLPSTLKALLVAGRGALARVQALVKAATTGAGPFSRSMHEERAIRFLPPVPDADRIVRVAPDSVAGEPVAIAIRGAALVGHNASVSCPRGSTGLECGPAIVFVIGRHAQDVSREDALDYVVGITLLDDFSRQNGRRKSAAAEADDELASLPIGSDLVTMDEIADLDDLWLSCVVNGEDRLRTNTRDHAWKLPEVLERFSREGPFEAGDLIALGARAGAVEGARESGGLLVKPGDVVECAIEGVVALRTTLVATAQA